MMNRYGKLSMIGDISVQIKINNTFKEKYGIDNVSKLSKLPNIKKKISDTISLYTDDKKESIKNKRSKTNLKKYGVNNVAKNNIIKFIVF